MSESSSDDEARIYIIPLRRAWICPRYRRAGRAVQLIKEFAETHMKSSEIRIAEELNEAIWRRGIQNPPRRVKVKMTKDEEGVVTVSLQSDNL